MSQNMSQVTPKQSEVSRNFRLKRVVVKIGSSLLTDQGKGLHRTAIYRWAEQIAQLHQSGIHVVLVSSGAVAEGLVRMRLPSRPTSLPKLQACAAIGQMGLIETWWSALIQNGVQSAQVLLTHDDLSHRDRYLNTGDMLEQLFDWAVVPIINENDTVTVDEIKFGDNDTLGAMAAALIRADLYIILTDQLGIYTDNPAHDPEATLISQEQAMADYLFDIAGEGGKLGRGGMLTKVKAARLAAMGGCPTIITLGEQENIIQRLAAGEPIGTLLLPETDKKPARKQWLAAHMQTAGRLVLDQGAIDAIKTHKKSLLPVGVKRVEGDFVAGDVVDCVDENGIKVAMGRANFSAAEAIQIAREQTDNIEKVLEQKTDRIVMIHRDDLVII